MNLIECQFISLYIQTIPIKCDHQKIMMSVTSNLDFHSCQHNQGSHHIDIIEIIVGCQT